MHAYLLGCRAQVASGALTKCEEAQAAPLRAAAPRGDHMRAKAALGEQQVLSMQQLPQAQGDPATLSGPVQKLPQTQARSQQLLQQTRHAMVKEVERMQATQEQLQQSSNVIEQTEATYNGQPRNLECS